MNKIASLMIVFSGFFITILPISPVYIFYLISLAAVTYSYFKTKKVQLNSMIAIAVIFIVYILITQIGIGRNLNHAVINVIFSLSTFILSFFIIEKLSNQQIIKISLNFIHASIFLLIIEAVWRIIHPSSSHVGFYNFKFNSIMYQDSNFVGIFIICLFFFSIYLNHYHLVNQRRELILLAILCLLTFSRASIFTMVCFGLIILVYINWNKIPGKKYIFSTLLLLSATLYIFYIRKDESFLSKFYILEKAVNFLKHTSFQNVLFGIGFGNTSKYLIIGAHNIIITYLLESGLFGLFLLLILFGDALRSTKLRAGIIIIPFLFNGLSLAGHAIPYLYCILAIIYMLEKTRGRLT